ncbi:SGNH/GDSL hydrolase family protein [Microbacterium sp. SSM24]|uniref:SGNH/GDSL hydrolase family protein n=1 Tax=Microbacterium sp. SSM24 TaxID=2991714 RepID=UPI0022269DF6|nr:SGNH/GDSL hydrolase family protein [Microbacterium sp. SSM24]MCW3491815.1 SGNH/GDSL hydrolase family protein [Microbacterium sp. SSM24]
MRRPRAVVVSAATVVVAGAAVAGVRSLLHRQARIARRRIGKPLGEDAVNADRVWGRRHEGEPVELALFGDSIAAGLGAQRRKDTLGARLAKGVARHAHRPVRLHTAAVVGAESSMLAAQVDGLPADYRPHVAVVIVGGNDVTHRVPIPAAAAHLAATVARLRGRGAEVVVGTCPDLGALRPVPQPLRTLGSRMSRQLAEAQADAATRAGAHVVSLRRAVGPFFVAQPDEMFSLDRFHPSALGYRRTAEALLPSVLEALHSGVRGR